MTARFAKGLAGQGQRGTNIGAGIPRQEWRTTGQHQEVMDYITRKGQVRALHLSRIAAHIRSTADRQTRGHSHGPRSYGVRGH